MSIGYDCEQADMSSCAARYLLHAMPRSFEIVATCACKIDCSIVLSLFENAKCSICSKDPNISHAFTSKYRFTNIESRSMLCLVRSSLWRHVQNRCDLFSTLRIRRCWIFCSKDNSNDVQHVLIILSIGIRSRVLIRIIEISLVPIPPSCYGPSACLDCINQ